VKQEKQKSTNRFVSLLGLLLISILLVSCRSVDKTANNHTNPDITPTKPQLVKFLEQTNGNFINRSELLLNQDWIYYTDYDQNGRVYRIRTDKTEKSIINRSPMLTYLFILDNRIHFFNYLDWSIMDKDGANQSQFPKLQYNGLPLETVPVNVIPYRDWIFFRGFPEILGDNEKSNLYKMNKDRSNITLIYHGGTDYLNVTPQALFFVELPSYHILTCQLDGSNVKKLNQEASKNLISDGEWVYYLNEEDNDTLYRIRSDGTQRVQITNDAIKCYNILNEWIYYSNHDDNDSLYRIKSDCTEKTKIIEGKTSHIYVYGDWIYYLNEEDCFQFYKLSLDGTINEPIADKD